MEIPVTFEYKGKEVKGVLSPLSGAGSNSTFHLNVDGYHWGQLSYIHGHPGFNGIHAVEAGWRFSSNQHPELSEMEDHFGFVVQAWIDSNG